MTTIAKQSWYSRGWNWHPSFYELKKGVLRRVSNERGLQMIQENILPLTDQLDKYFKEKKINVNPLPESSTP